MSKKLDELQGYEIRCAEQEDIIEMLEREIERLNKSLWSVQAENRRLAVMLISQPPTKPTQTPADPNNNKEDDNKKNESSAKSDKDESTLSEETPSDETKNTEHGDKTDEDVCPYENDEECPFVDAEDCPYINEDDPPKEEERPKPKTYKEKLVYECKEFLEKYSFSAFFKAISMDIIGQEEGLKRLLAVLYNFLYTLSLGETPERCSTALLTAPSGNGKSALFKALKEFFEAEIPSLVCSRKDASRLTPEGYRGTTVNNILSEFAPYHKFDLQQRYGILWLDEFDKVKFNRDTGGPQVQAQLLAFMDGHTEKIGNTAVDTRGIFWVCAGSFNEVREKKKQKAEKTMGFVAQEKAYDTYDDITREDVLKLFSHETVGRFNLIVNFKKLSEMAIIRIIAKTLGEISKDIRVDAVLGEDYMNVLVREANSGFGCRQIYNTLYETCLQAFISIMQDGIYGIDEMPLIVIEGPNDFTILDEAVGDQIKYETCEE